MNKGFATLAFLPLVGGSALAANTLTDMQLDRVTAGFTLTLPAIDCPLSACTGASSSSSTMNGVTTLTSNITPPLGTGGTGGTGNTGGTGGTGNTSGTGNNGGTGGTGNNGGGTGDTGNNGSGAGGSGGSGGTSSGNGSSSGTGAPIFGNPIVTPGLNPILAAILNSLPHE